MMTTKLRIHYYDLAKGILMILVILHHLHMQGTKILGSNSISVVLDYADDYWVMFFMPAFFMITGMCSSFNKDFRTFVWSNFKGLIIPSIVIGFFFILLYQSTIGGFWILHECKLLIIKYIPSGGVMWFLSALFVCKLIYYGLGKCVRSIKKRLIIALAISIIGYWLGILNVNNPWCYIQALIYLPFLPLGQILRQHPPTLKLSLFLGFILIISVTIAHIEDFEVPYVSYALNYNLFSALPLLGYATIGSIAFLGICRILDHGMFLEYFGRNSLVVYASHIVVMQILFTIVKANTFVDINNMYILAFTYIIVFILDVVICCFFNWLFSRKYLCYSLGKF